MLLRCLKYGVLILFTYFQLDRTDAIEVIETDELTRSYHMKDINQSLEEERNHGKFQRCLISVKLN